jgi:hypothetical protein
MADTVDVFLNIASAHLSSPAAVNSSALHFKNLNVSSLHWGFLCHQAAAGMAHKCQETTALGTSLKQWGWKLHDK